MDDSTSIWFMQAIGRELRFIDYYEAAGEGLAHYAAVLKGKPYVYGDHYMPHDADVRELGTGTSRKSTAEALGIRPVIVVPRPRDTQAVLSGIEAARNIMSRCWFDEKRCARGLAALEGYRSEYDEERKKLADRPLHDWCSHGADSFSDVRRRLQSPRLVAVRYVHDERHRPEGEMVRQKRFFMSGEAPVACRRRGWAVNYAAVCIAYLPACRAANLVRERAWGAEPQ